MNKKKIESAEDFKAALDKIYSQTDKKIIREFVNPRSEFVHLVSSCSDCPFVTRVQTLSGDSESMIQHTYCLWDNKKTDIQNFIESTEPIVPSDCPMIDNEIKVKFKDVNK